MTARRVRVPGYEDVDLTEAGAHLLGVVHNFDQGARSDADGCRERVYHPGPSEGNVAKALVARGLLRRAHSSGKTWDSGVESTAAGCAVLAALRRR